MFLLPVLALGGCSGNDDKSDGKDGGTTDPDVQGPLEVGVGRARMPVPVGIGTAGYGGFGISNPSPYAEIYPATENVFEHPDFRAVAISRGPGHTVVFLRSDTVGIFQQFRRAVVDEVLERTGQDLDGGLVIGATHTHAGPGRVVDGGGVYDLITDKFFPEFYERMVHAMADAVVAALDDLAPGRLGVGDATAPDGHDDRRCEDGLDYTNDRLPMVAVEREGEVVGLVMAYAVHGTVFDISEFTLSKDVAGGIEQAVAGRFDHPVTVMMLNSWGADMSPANPTVPPSAVPEKQARIALVGELVADDVETALAGLAWSEEPDIVSATWRVPIDRDAIGYADGEFPYEYGGVYCEGESDCDPLTEVDGLDHTCLPFNVTFPAPMQTELTAGHLGDLAFVTFPGEPGTLLAEQVMAAMAADGAGDIAFFGYSQDYLGYSILEDDWWQGGYEASGALWGPRQGEYLAGRAVEAWRWSEGLATPPDDAPERIAPFPDHDDPPVEPEPAIDAGTVVADVAATYPTDALVTFSVRGTDPWNGTPIAHLEDADGNAILGPDGAPWTSDRLPFAWHLEVVPPYEEEAPRREFQWQLTFPTTHPVAAAALPLSGPATVVVELPDGTVVRSGAFEVQ